MIIIALNDKKWNIKNARVPWLTNNLKGMWTMRIIQVLRKFFKFLFYFYFNRKKQMKEKHDEIRKKYGKEIQIKLNLGSS